jgi:hypothetical protein
MAEYSPPGFLLFQRDGTLFAQPFDADRLALERKRGVFRKRWQRGGGSKRPHRRCFRWYGAQLRSRNIQLSLFQTPIVFTGTVRGPAYPYDVTADGQRFLLLTPIDEDRIIPITVVLNWQSRLAARESR